MTAESETYQGWKNYETWAVNLWLTNDEGTYNYWRETARELYADAVRTNVFTREESARFALADQLKSEVEEAAPELDGIYADLLNAAMCEVNWDEIASDFLDGIGD